MSYVAPVFVSGDPLEVADIQAGFEDFRTACRELDDVSLSGITTEKIVVPRILQSTDTGYDAYYESGILIGRSQTSSDLRAPAIEGAWTPAGTWSYYDSNSTRNVPPASRPLNGVIDVGPLPGSSATIYIPRNAIVIVTAKFHLSPQSPESINNQLTNNPKTMTLSLQHRDTDSTTGNWRTSFIYHQPWVSLDSYLRGHWFRTMDTVDDGWHSWNVLCRDASNFMAYSFVGASTFTIEVFYAE